MASVSFNQSSPQGPRPRPGGLTRAIQEALSKAGIAPYRTPAGHQVYYGEILGRNGDGTYQVMRSGCTVPLTRVRPNADARARAILARGETVLMFQPFPNSWVITD